MQRLYLEADSQAPSAVVFVLGQHRIGLYARYDMSAGTEVSFALLPSSRGEASTETCLLSPSHSSSSTMGSTLTRARRLPRDQLSSPSTTTMTMHRMRPRIFD